MRSTLYRRPSSVAACPSDPPAPTPDPGSPGGALAIGRPPLARSMDEVPIGRTEPSGSVGDPDGAPAVGRPTPGRVAMGAGGSRPPPSPARPVATEAKVSTGIRARSRDPARMAAPGAGTGGSNVSCGAATTAGGGAPGSRRGGGGTASAGARGGG